MTEGGLTISQAIDRMILSVDSASMLLEKYSNHFIENRVVFLSELAVRLSSDRLESFCDTIVWNEPSQPKYIYQDVHLKVAQQKIRPTDATDRMVVFRQRELAYELWKKNRFMELQSILPTIQSRLQLEKGSQSTENSESEVEKKEVGLYWTSTNEDLTLLFKELKRNSLIPEDTNENIFFDTFNHKRDHRDP
ncbi:hypothetical protein [Sanyastnella coralliicola]|uniref:hypothetical protein n=1 Tax=Sanyastnella coralliicola TaxID=3069118 RepID=UPI0027B98CC1|nr:hypothetical protein [Longitalea sp. SCSIO 12813]